MPKFKIKKLDNGITLLMCNDPTKHIVNITITTRYGGAITKFKVGDKDYTVTSGMAHFLEHYLIEYSKYGNAFKYFTQDKYADFNGYTSSDYTDFYVETPHDYLELFKELLDIVNKPVFTQENIDSNKPAIIEEINKKEDDQYGKFYFFTMNNIFKKLKFKHSLGTKEEIQNLKVDEVKLAYDAFYRPDNQTISISGCFDEEEVIKLVNNYFKKDTKREKVTVKKVKEPLEVNKKYADMYDKVHDTYTRITYKLSLKGYKQKELIKLMYYLGIYLDSCFDASSEIYQKLVEDKVIEYNINYGYDIFNNILMIYFTDHTLKSKEFIDGITSTINSKKYDEEFFNLALSKSLISFVIRQDDPHKKIRQQQSYYFDFNYKKEIKAKDYEQFNFQEYQEYINKLSFDNYGVTEMKQEEK